jgi:hypothetical protein
MGVPGLECRGFQVGSRNDVWQKIKKSVFNYENVIIGMDKISFL